MQTVVGKLVRIGRTIQIATTEYTKVSLPAARGVVEQALALQDAALVSATVENGRITSIERTTKPRSPIATALVAAGASITDNRHEDAFITEAGWHIRDYSRGNELFIETHKNDAAVKADPKTGRCEQRRVEVRITGARTDENIRNAATLAAGADTMLAEAEAVIAKEPRLLGFEFAVQHPSLRVRVSVNHDC